MDSRSVKRSIKRSIKRPTFTDSTDSPDSTDSTNSSSKMHVTESSTGSAVPTPVAVAVTAPVENKQVRYIKCNTIKIFDQSYFTISSEFHDCEKCDKCIINTSPISIDNELISEENIELFISYLRNESRDVIIHELIEMKNEIIKHKSLAQNQIIETNLLIQQIINLFIKSDDLYILELICNLLSTICNNNKKTIEFIFKIKDVIEKFKWIISRSNSHCKDNSCTSDCLHEKDGISQCRMILIGKNYMWLLSLACTLYTPIHKTIISNSILFQSIYEHLTYNNDDVQSASLFLITQIIKHSDVLKIIKKNTPIINYVVNIMNTCTIIINTGTIIINTGTIIINTGMIIKKVFLCWMITELINNDKDVKLYLLSRGIIDFFHQLIHETNSLIDTQNIAVFIQENAICSLRKLCEECDEIKTEIREKGVITTLSNLLDPHINIIIKNKVYLLIVHLCKKNKLNQNAIADLGIIEKILLNINVKEMKEVVLEKIFSAVLTIILENNENCVRVINFPDFINIILSCCNNSMNNRIKALSCAIIRLLLSHNKEIHSTFIARGLISVLTDLIFTPDHFLQEQVIVIIYNLIIISQANINLFNALNVHVKLCSVLEDFTKSTMITYKCTTVCIYKLCENNEEICTNIKERPQIINTLLKLCKSSDQQLKIYSYKLLNKIDPLIDVSKIIIFTDSILSAFTTFTPICRNAFECSICMDVTIKETVFLPCIHKFHKECIGDWFHQGKYTCPECKTNVMTDLHDLIGVDMKILSILKNYVSETLVIDDESLIESVSSSSSSE